jgi:membrane protein
MASAHRFPGTGLLQHARQEEKRFQPLLDFWMKVSNDWIFQFSAMLSYSFLTSLFPLLLVILAIAGLLLGAISPQSLAAFQDSLAQALPTGIGRQFISAVVTDLHHSAGFLLVIGVVTSLFTGSRLFIAIENCTGIIFRLRGRDPLHQNLTALAMTVLYVLLVPLIFGATAIPSAMLHALGIPTHRGVGAILTQLIGIGTGYIAAVVLFGAIYIVVPNRPVHWKEVWKGALVAAGLMVLYELLFPLYSATLLHPHNYGAVAGFALVILAFFYYLAFILLFGMEINSWISGQHQTAADIQGVFHEVQAHNTTRGAAGPDAGTPAADIEHRQGARAMQGEQSAIKHERKDHRTDAQPPRYAEANQHEATADRPRSSPTTTTHNRAPSPSTQPSNHADEILAEVILAGAVLAPALLWMLKRTRR